jgi:glycerol kinase
MKKYVLAIDQGTTSSRAILFNKKGEIVSVGQKEIKMIYQKEDYVEQEAFDIWISVIASMADCMLKANVEPSEVVSIGITNQRETTILWDRKTGIPVYKAIVWQSKQSDYICDKLKEQGLTETIKQKTGLLIDPYFSATKIRWVLDNVPKAKELMENGDLMFGTVDTWLLYKLTGQKVHKTDFSNASRTMLFNINTLTWDEELLNYLSIDQSILPEVCDSNALFGETVEYAFFGERVPITGVLGDQQAALFGHLCLEEGEVKTTYGTGSFMLMNTGNKIVPSNLGLLTTIAYGMDGKINYALEGSVFISGSAIQWLRDELEFFKDSKDSEELSQSVQDNYGVVVVPAFSGLGTPYWESGCKGAIYGLTRGTNKAHITRATLEAMAFQTKDIIGVMKEESKINIRTMKVDGGASKNNFLMQFQSSILKTSISRPQINEMTALGAAYISGLSSGFYESIDVLKSLNTNSTVFIPSMSDDQINSLYSKWKKAIQATILFN